MPSKKNLFLRSLIIYLITILFGTLVAAFFVGMNDFWGMFVIGLLITGAISSPNILIMFFGFIMIYKIEILYKNKWISLFFLCFFICCLPLLLYLNYSVYSPGMEFNVLLEIISISMGYITTAFSSIFFVNAYFDRKYPPKEEFKISVNEDENILDDGFIN